MRLPVVNINIIQFKLAIRVKMNDGKGFNCWKIVLCESVILTGGQKCTVDGRPINMSLLGLLDLSYAFHTFNRNILVDRLHTAFEIRGKVLYWINLFVS